MIDKGTYKKSMAYVSNIVTFIQYCLQTQKPGYCLFNYIDKPDTNMNELIEQVKKSLSKKLPAIGSPYWFGYMGGMGNNTLAKLTSKKFSVSTVRVKKFCATTRFDATLVHNSGFGTLYSFGWSSQHVVLGIYGARKG